MKKNSLFGLIFIILAGILYNASAQPIKNIGIDIVAEEELLMEAIEASGFQMEEFNINKSVFAKDLFLSIEELEEKRNNILDTLNIQGEIVPINIDKIYNNYQGNYFEDLLDISSDVILEQRIEDEGYNEIIVFIPNEAGNVTLIKLLSTQIVGESETYIIIDIIQNKGYKEIVTISNKIEDILQQYGNKVETTINITGVHLGKLTKAEEKQSQESVFNFLEAKKIEVLENELLTSITAYSPLISSYINYGNNKVNLQLAMRYSEYEDKTYLWIANPLITTTY